MRTRILIYGGTSLDPPQRAFVASVVRRLLEHPDVVILTGGFKEWNRSAHPERREWVSVDRVVRETTVRVLQDAGDNNLLSNRLETWLGDDHLDRKDVLRYVDEARFLDGRSDQARRFKLVTMADAVLTVSGEGNTATVLELAMAIERPTLPVACTGGDSEKFWRAHVDWFRSSLSPRGGRGLDDAIVARLSDPNALGRDDSIGELAIDIADIMYAAALKRCLVLMPFDEGDTWYDDVIAPAVRAASYVPERLDRLPSAGDIREIFRDRLSRSHEILIDVTGTNPNVMFELGYVWATSVAKPPVLVLRHPLDQRAFDALPFYLKPLQIASADGTTLEGRRTLAERITSFLGGEPHHRASG